MKLPRCNLLKVLNGRALRADITLPHQRLGSVAFAVSPAVCFYLDIHRMGYFKIYLVTKVLNKILHYISLLRLRVAGIFWLGFPLGTIVRIDLISVYQWDSGECISVKEKHWSPFIQKSTEVTLYMYIITLGSIVIGGS